MTEGEESKSGWLGVLGRAAYLACSWTWCIGMFLPVLLVRDYGLWGFVVFAVPNVVGAGAMGWVLSRESSRRIARSHAGACLVFSVVTVCFQAYFLGWMPFRLLENAGYPTSHGLSLVVLGLLAVSACAAAALWWRATDQRLEVAGLVTLVISAAAAIVMVALGAPDYWSRAEARQVLGADHSQVIWLAPVCMFGFAFCPYLDLTFHRVRQSLPDGDARRAFGLGFGLMFFSMILITLMVAPLMIGLMGWPIWFVAGFGLACLLAVHFVVQLTYTVLVHAVELRAIGGRRRTDIAVAIAVLAVTCGLIGGGVGRTLHDGMFDGEVIYRVFMSFYGLVFPAYVWLCVIPGRGERQTAAPSRAKLAVLSVACAMATPCYWMGFIERETVWLVPGLGIVLVARLFVKKTPCEAASPAGVFRSETWRRGKGL